MSRIATFVLVLLAAGSAAAQEALDERAPEQRSSAAAEAEPVAKTDDASTPAAADEAKTLLGISILGNQEAPKSLVIVPWKGSQIGDMPGLSRLLDDSMRPVDKEVFMRELAYFEIRSNP